MKMDEEYFEVNDNSILLNCSNFITIHSVDDITFMVIQIRAEQLRINTTKE